MSELIDLYHRTTPKNARSIRATGNFRSLENDGAVYFSTVRNGQGTGYGDAVVHVRIPVEFAQLDDEFPDGEQHYKVLRRFLGLEDIIPD